ncbi:hypothetical protein BC938DRAFT_474845 [Jimgerdemannia flammicorona]|uniref:Uncharacterized protein n=1 Tax=Jimgerdemannia flammicorona TaxID=994334 RepID=A0A433Q1K8_9FUNG|nr:hypothetical protein BC938DRAFT_474845 [Jimgerdemannia flammicorona]
MAVSIAYSSVQPNGTSRSDFVDEDDDVSLAAFMTPSWRFDQEKLVGPSSCTTCENNLSPLLRNEGNDTGLCATMAYDVLANQQSGMSVSPDWATLYADPAADQLTMPYTRHRTSSNNSNRSHAPAPQNHTPSNVPVKTMISRQSTSSSLTPSTSPSLSRPYQSSTPSEAGPARRAPVAATPPSRGISQATIPSSNDASQSARPPHTSTDGSITAFGDEIAHNFLHPKYQEHRRGSITSVKSEMSTKSGVGKLSFSKRLRRVLSMNNMKDDDKSASIHGYSEESTHSSVSDFSSNTPSRFMLNHNLSSSRQNGLDNASEVSLVTASSGSGGSVRASEPPLRPETSQPMISRRRSLASLSSLFSRNQASQGPVEQYLASTVPAQTPNTPQPLPADRSFAAIVRRRHSSGDLKNLASERDTERESTLKLDSKKTLSKDDSAPFRNSLGIVKKARPTMLHFDSSEGRDPVKGILKLPKSSQNISADSSVMPGGSRQAGLTPTPAHQLDLPNDPRGLVLADQATSLPTYPFDSDTVSLTPSSSTSSSDADIQPHLELNGLMDVSTDNQLVLPSALTAPGPASRRNNTVPTISTPAELFRTPRSQRSLQFAPSIQIHETHASGDYDRRCDTNVTCAKLTPLIAMKIKQELNEYKLKEMDVHIDSRIYTHFFL